MVRSCRFNNKWMAGAWIAGQAENNLRVTDMAKILRVPLVWLVNCSGAAFTEQEKCMPANGVRVPVSIAMQS